MTMCVCHIRALNLMESLKSHLLSCLITFVEPIYSTYLFLPQVCSVVLSVKATPSNATHAWLPMRMTATDRALPPALNMLMPALPSQDPVSTHTCAIQVWLDQHSLEVSNTLMTNRTCSSHQKHLSNSGDQRYTCGFLELSICTCVCERGEKKSESVWERVLTASHHMNTTFTLCFKDGFTCCCVSPPLLDTVVKSCTYKGFCSKAHGSSSGAKMECCFADDCNGPHRGHSHGDHHHNGAGARATSPILLVTALLLRMAFTQLWIPATFCPPSDSSSLSLCPSESFSHFWSHSCWFDEQQWSTPTSYVCIIGRTWVWFLAGAGPEWVTSAELAWHFRTTIFTRVIAMGNRKDIVFHHT